MACCTGTCRFSLSGQGLFGLAVHGAGVAVGNRPVLVASAAFLAGAFCGVTLGSDLALGLSAAALLLAFAPRLRLSAIALALGLVRAAVAPHATDHPAVIGEATARVESVDGRRVLLRLEDGARAQAWAEGLHRGELWLFDLKLWRPPPRLNPGGRDERKELAARGISLSGSARPLELREPGPAFFRFADGVRARFVSRAALICTDLDRAALVAALGVGDRSLLTPEAEDDLAASGLVHLLASSGLHLAVVAFLAREGLRRAWLWTPWGSRVRASVVGSLCAMPLVVAEVVLLGAPWPALRAGAAALLALLAAALQRRADGLRLLCLALCACALLDPGATHDLALQLSAAGIFGLVTVTRPLRDLLPARRTRAEPLLRLACATAAATLCTAPLIAAAFHRVSIVSVAANALALWPGLCTIPLATAVVALDWTPLWFCADQLAGLTLWASRLFAHLPFASVRVATPGIAACAAWWLAVALLVRHRLRAAAAFAGLACLTLLRFAPGEVRITFLAVGQGDAALVQFPSGESMLIDGGGDLRWPARADPGARVVLPALAELGIRSLDLVVLTHPHPDHAGGLFTVLDRVPVRELWMHPGSDPISRAVAQRAAERGVPVGAPHPRSFGDVRVEVLSHHDPRRSPNDDSIVLRLVDRHARALFAADVEAFAESDLTRHELSAQLLKAPHHGSRTSSTDAFLRGVAPRDVIYSVGAHNPFGFPHPDVVARTVALGARTRDTGQGYVEAVSTGAGWTLGP